MLEERYRQLGLKRDEILGGFGHSNGHPGFWCYKAEVNDVVDCVRNCGTCLSCGEKFRLISAEDHLEGARYDWGLMALMGQVQTPWHELDNINIIGGAVVG